MLQFFFQSLKFSLKDSCLVMVSDRTTALSPYLLLALFAYFVLLQWFCSASCKLAFSWGKLHWIHEFLWKMEKVCSNSQRSLSTAQEGLTNQLRPGEFCDGKNSTFFLNAPFCKGNQTQSGLKHDQEIPRISWETMRRDMKTALNVEECSIKQDICSIHRDPHVFARPDKAKKRYSFRRNSCQHFV